MREFLKIKYETPELKVILVDEDIITGSMDEEYSDILGPEVSPEDE